MHLDAAATTRTLGDSVLTPVLSEESEILGIHKIQQLAGKHTLSYIRYCAQ
jgi:hypothetical protein